MYMFVNAVRYVRIYSIYTVLHTWHVPQRNVPIYIHIYNNICMYVCGDSVLLKDSATLTVVGEHAES